MLICIHESKIKIEKHCRCGIIVWSDNVYGNETYVFFGGMGGWRSSSTEQAGMMTE